MNCQVCGKDNPDDFKFCQECGQELIKIHFCPACGYKNQAAAKFCTDCGNSFQPVLAKDQGPALQAPIHNPQPVIHQQAASAPQSLPPQINYPPPGQLQPSVVYVREQQPKPSFNLFNVIWRFGGSLIMGYLMTELGKYFLSVF